MGVAGRDVTEAVRPSSLRGRASLSSQVAFHAVEQRKVTVKVREDRTERALCVLEREQGAGRHGPRSLRKSGPWQRGKKHPRDKDVVRVPCLFLDQRLLRISRRV